MRLFSDVASRVDDPYLAHAAALAERARGHALAQSRSSAASSFATAASSARASTRAPACRTPRSSRSRMRAQQARGADVYVTLEPCAHHGKTPPCVDALVAAGVARVVIGMPDPNPEAAGGAETLCARQASRSTSPRTLRRSRRSTRAGCTRLETGMPFVTRRSRGSPSTLGSRSRRASGRRSPALRAPRSPGVCGQRADAVLVSAATVTRRRSRAHRARRPGRRSPSASRCVSSSCASACRRPDARVFTDGRARRRSCSPATRPTPKPLGGARHRTWQSLAGRPLRACAAPCRRLGEHGVGSLLVEPGPRLLTRAVGRGPYRRVRHGHRRRHGRRRRPRSSSARPIAKEMPWCVG